MNRCLSDEQVHIRFLRPFEVGSYTAQRDVVQQFLFLYAHNVHAHGAGNHFDTIVYGLLYEAFQAVDPLLFHDEAHHPASGAAHIHFRQFELSAVGREHPAEHFAEKVF